MKANGRFLATCAVVCALATIAPRSANAFDVKQVIEMHKDGIPDSLILEKIEHSGTHFDLDARDLRALKYAGVSDAVTVAMLRTEDAYQRPLVYDGRTWAYDPAWYFGFDVGFGAPYRFRHPYRRPFFIAHGRR